MSVENYTLLVNIWIALALIVLPILLKVSAPYGRHFRKGWGPTIPNRTAWIVMELPSPVLFSIFFWSGPNRQETVTFVFFLLYTLHYMNRSLIFPLRMHTSERKMPLVIAVSAILFNLVNGSLNGYWFGNISGEYHADWLFDPRFISGGILFLAGALINLQSDNLLLSLRKNGAGEYTIPSGGLFRYVSCPNFFGEILEWAGFALMTWSPAALAFSVWTGVNLVPRALDHHSWYRERFDDYPPERKAVIPFIL